MKNHVLWSTIKSMEASELTPEQYIVDSSGKKTHVVLRIEDYQHIIEDLEDLAAIEEYEKNKDQEKLISWEEAKRQIGL